MPCRRPRCTPSGKRRTAWRVQLERHVSPWDPVIPLLGAGVCSKNEKSVLSMRCLAGYTDESGSDVRKGSATVFKSALPSDIGCLAQGLKRIKCSADLGQYRRGLHGDNLLHPTLLSRGMSVTGPSALVDIFTGCT